VRRNEGHFAEASGRSRSCAKRESFRCQLESLLNDLDAFRAKRRFRPGRRCREKRCLDCLASVTGELPLPLSRLNGAGFAAAQGCFGDLSRGVNLHRRRANE